jgi:XTP/dITP diphosphohydrolase
VELVVASANPDKVAEMAEILNEAGVTLVARPADLDDVDENADTLEGNARLKARAVCNATGRPALADDTGLEVDALGGAPGVRSARYAGDESNSAANIQKLLAELRRVGATRPEQRRARFRTVAVVGYPDGREVVAEGTVKGTIAVEPIGGGGFGYDSVFVPDAGGGRSFAQMPAGEKHQISHRGRAFRALTDRLR